MNIYVVRHGQTDYNVKNIFQGHIDIPLNEVGKEQAKQTAKKFENINIDSIITSPLIRTRQTAKYINEVVNAEIVIDERLIERSFGDMEGNSNREDWNIKMMLDYDKNYTNYNIEPVQEFFKRINQFVDDIIKKNKDRNIILVTHGAVSQVIECYFKGMPSVRDFEHFEKLTLKNCEIRQYSI